MATIRAEHDTQNRIILAQKAALDVVIADLSSLRLMGKQDADVVEGSRSATPGMDTLALDVEMEGEGTQTREESGELREEASDNERDSDEDIPLAKILNPSARAFVPGTSRTATPVLPTAGSTPAVMMDDDIEMGELAEEPKQSQESKAKKKIREEELEEGEASDQSSELSEPPDD